MAIEIKSEAEIEVMREAGAILAEVLGIVLEAVQPGVKETEIDDLVRREFQRRDVIPTFLGYPPGGEFPYPATVCISVNDEIVHGIPGSRAFQDGDLVSIDLGLTHRGFVADAARTVACGQATSEVSALIEATRRSLEIGIEQLHPGRRMGDIGAAIHQYAEGLGYSVVREYVGHGVGRLMHEEPQVPNYGIPGKGIKLQSGMVLALEPMLNVGTWQTRRDADNWTVLTADGSLSAHFEDTVAVTDSGPLVLTALRESALVGGRQTI